MRVRALLLVVPLAFAFAVALAVAAATGLAVAGTSGLEPTCGVERWAVKTLQDPAGRNINLAQVKKTTVNALRSLPVQRGPRGSRGNGAESTEYEVKARLVSARLEGDSDIHLVIRGATTSGTMIVEFPTVLCTRNATSRAKTQMRNARKAFVAACGMPDSSSFTKVRGRATIRGIGFFDFKRGQTGIAPNGIELHPVINFAEATCTRAATDPNAPQAVAVKTDVVSDWVVLLICLGYAVVAWFVQMYRVVPPRDWLLQRIWYLETEPDPEAPPADEKSRLKADLDKVKSSIDRWFVRVGVSRVQAGWRNIHGIEDDSLLHASSHIVDEKLRTIRTRLAGIKGAEAKSFRGRIDNALKETSNHPERAALLREASMFRHNHADTRYEDIAGLLSKAVFLTVVALAIVVALAATFDRESWFLLGATGALISRLSRVVRRRPSPSDYGAEWSTLILSPALGAVAGWVGVLIVVALADPPFDVLDDQFSELWNDPTKPIGLILAFAFGFSERLFNRLLRSAIRQVGGALPEEEAAQSSGRESNGT